MKNRDCDICENKNLPLNETIQIDHKIYCSECIDKNFHSKEDLKGKLVVREKDPTICSFCQQDFGATILNQISDYPICADCAIKVKNKTFPTWVKAFFAGIILLVSFGFFWNWKYYVAYQNINQANASFKSGDYSNATKLMSSASGKVPEVEDLAVLTNYYHGVDLLTKDKNDSALLLFRLIKDQLPATFDIDRLIVQAKIGVCFDKKDYQGFLSAAKENLAFDTTLATSVASVASAYSCIYADKANEEAKANALLFMGKAKAIDDSSQEMKLYMNMLEYRLDAKKVINRADFVKQFPNGWVKN